MKNIIMWFNKLKIKFFNWIRGGGFKIPKANPTLHCMYNYCKSIVNEEVIYQIQAYEDKITEIKEKYPKATRKEIAKTYIEALEWIYGKENI